MHWEILHHLLKYEEGVSSFFLVNCRGHQWCALDLAFLTPACTQYYTESWTKAIAEYLSAMSGLTSTSPVTLTFEESLEVLAMTLEALNEEAT